MTLSYSPRSVSDRRSEVPASAPGHAGAELRTSVNFVNFGAAR